MKNRKKKSEEEEKKGEGRGKRTRDGDLVQSRASQVQTLNYGSCADGVKRKKRHGIPDTRGQKITH